MDATGVLSFQPDVIIEHSEGDGRFRIGAGFKFQMENLVIALQKNERVRTNGFLYQFGFEYLNVDGFVNG
jgi:hypothetical protein